MKTITVALLCQFSYVVSLEKTTQASTLSFGLKALTQPIKRKHDIDYCKYDKALGMTSLHYLNFESWLAYKRKEHEQKNGRVNAERGWWDKK